MIATFAALTCLTFFILGYIAGKVESVRQLLASDDGKRPASFISQVKEAKKSRAKIDESTFVTEVSTDTLQRSYDEIGQTTVSQDSVDGSVSKLSQLKGKKG